MHGKTHGNLHGHRQTEVITHEGGASVRNRNRDIRFTRTHSHTNRQTDRQTHTHTHTHHSIAPNPIVDPVKKL